METSPEQPQPRSSAHTCPRARDPYLPHFLCCWVTSEAALALLWLLLSFSPAFSFSPGVTRAGKTLLCQVKVTQIVICPLSPCSLSAVGDIGFPCKPDFFGLSSLGPFRVKSTAKVGERAGPGAADTAERGATHLGVFPGGLAALGLLRKQMGVVAAAQGAAPAPWAGGAHTEVSRWPQLEVAGAVGRIRGSASPGARGRLLWVFNTALGLECSGSAQPCRAT